MALLKQKTFDMVWDHLLTQMQKSEDGFGSCYYRDNSNNFCAIGIFISDEKYDLNIEGCSVQEIQRRGFLELLPMTEEGLMTIDEQENEFLCDLQSVHDENYPEEWKDALCDVAKKWGIKEGGFV